MKEGEGYFTCSGSRSRVFDCTCHYIRNVALEQLVREDLRRVITFVQEQEDEFMRLTMETTLQEQRKDEAKMKQDLAEMRSRVAELDGFMKRIYAERNGIMPVKATMPFPAQGTRLLHSI